MGRRIGYRKVEEVIPTRPVCGEIDCTKLYCMPESHWKTRTCRTPDGDTIVMGAYTMAFPNRCPFCYTDIPWASQRLIHECPGGAPYPYSAATAYQIELSEYFAMQKIEQRGRQTKEELEHNRKHEILRIESHLRWCCTTCKCDKCTLLKNTPSAPFIIVKSAFGDLKIKRPPKLCEPPPLPKNMKKRQRDREVICVTTTKRRIKWHDEESCTSGGIGNLATHGRKPKRKPWVMRHQPVRSQKFEGSKTVSVGDTGYVELTGFD